MYWIKRSVLQHSASMSSFILPSRSLKHSHHDHCNSERSLQPNIINAVELGDSAEISLLSLSIMREISGKRG